MRRGNDVKAPSKVNRQRSRDYLCAPLAPHQTGISYPSGACFPLFSGDEQEPLDDDLTAKDHVFMCTIHLPPLATGPA